MNALRAKLTIKEQAAADHFIVHGNKAGAYRASYSTTNMKPSTIERRSLEVFSRPQVQAYVDAAKKAATSKAVLTRQEALEILSDIARGKLADFFTEDGVIDLTAIAASGYSLEEFSVAVGKFGDTTKIKVRNPIQAIERLSKMLGWDQAQKIELEGCTFDINLAGE